MVDIANLYMNTFLKLIFNNCKITTEKFIINTLVKVCNHLTNNTHFLIISY